MAIKKNKFQPSRIRFYRPPLSKLDICESCCCSPSCSTYVSLLHHLAFYLPAFSMLSFFPFLFCLTFCLSFFGNVFISLSFFTTLSFHFYLSLSFLQFCLSISVRLWVCDRNAKDRRSSSFDGEQVIFKPGGVV